MIFNAKTLCFLLMSACLITASFSVQANVQKTIRFMGYKVPNITQKPVSASHAKDTRTDTAFRMFRELNVDLGQHETDKRKKPSSKADISFLNENDAVSHHSGEFLAHNREYKTFMFTNKINLNDSKQENPLNHITPYLAFGAGIAKHDGSVLDSQQALHDAEKSDSGLAWQFGGGMQMPLGKTTSLNTEYRYFETSRFDTGYRQESFDDHRIMLGVTFQLD